MLLRAFFAAAALAAAACGSQIAAAQGQKVTCYDSTVIYDYCSSNRLPPNQVECYPADNVPRGCVKSPAYSSVGVLCCDHKFGSGGCAPDNTFCEHDSECCSGVCVIPTGGGDYIGKVCYPRQQ